MELHRITEITQHKFLLSYAVYNVMKMFTQTDLHVAKETKNKSHCPSLLVKWLSLGVWVSHGITLSMNKKHRIDHIIPSFHLQ